jgi:hypothetical protein
LPNFLFEHAWPGMVVWGLQYVSDYSLTIVCARLYGRQKTIVFEGSYEITPFYQRDIDSLRVESPRFIFMLLLALGALGFLWILNESSPAPELWQFALGAPWSEPNWLFTCVIFVILFSFGQSSTRNRFVVTSSTAEVCCYGLRHGSASHSLVSI